MNAGESYLKSRIDSATPGGLIILLYEGLLRHCDEARLSLEEGSEGGVQDAGISIGKAIAILTELNSSLDSHSAPELTAQLSQLYEFFTVTLSNALKERDAQPISGITPLIEDLLDAWQQAEASSQSEAPLSVR